MAPRLRRVEIDLDHVFPEGALPSAASAADSITLNLFPDVCVTAAREGATDLGGGTVQWIGQVQGAVSGKAMLVINGRVMVGTVTIGGKTFQISYLGDGVHAVVAIDQSEFPRD